jgi:hypothetical protein
MEVTLAAVTVYLLHRPFVTTCSSISKYVSFVELSIHLKMYALRLSQPSGETHLRRRPPLADRGCRVIVRFKGADGLVGNTTAFHVKFEHPFSGVVTSASLHVLTPIA